MTTRKGVPHNYFFIYRYSDEEACHAEPCVSLGTLQDITDFIDENLKMVPLFEMIYGKHLAEQCNITIKNMVSCNTMAGRDLSPEQVYGG